MKFFLIVAKGKKQGMPIPVEVDLFLIGSGPMCQLRAVHDKIGEQHCALVIRDRKKIFIGSANLDPRSLNLNTEIGLMIDSPELARQVVARFDAIAQPANSFVLALESVGNGSPKLVWKSLKDGQTIVYDSEPGDDRWREMLVELYGTLPLEDQL